MKHLQRIDEAVGTILERRASAESLLKGVVKGDSTEVEGIKMSKDMADAFLDWLRGSTYGKKFGALPFYKLFSASFNWGIERYIGKDLKAELKELKAKAKSMKEANEINEAKSPLNIANAAVLKADVPLSYAKDYIDSLTRMSKRDKKKFKEYNNFSEDDFIEDVEYNMANEAKVISEELKGHAKKMKEDGVSDEEIKKMHPEVTDEDLKEGKDFEPHMMYDPETGEEYKAEQPEDHERMAKLGYVHEKPESVDEGRFVKDFNKDVLDAKTKEEVLKLYPNAEFFIGKHSHFFGELDDNLFFKAYYTKGQKEFKIKSVYSEKNKNYVNLFNESLNESSGSEERRIALRAIKSIAKYLNRDLLTSAQYLLNATEDVQRDIKKGKIK